MAFGLRKIDLESIADAKLADAKLLLEHGRWSNAYYLAGYAAEIAIKACIAKVMSANTIPDLAFIKSVYQHDLKQLVGLAGLAGELKKRENGDADFGAYWGIVSQWRPDARYGRADVYTSQLMLRALSHETSGVMPWIKTFW